MAGEGRNNSLTMNLLRNLATAESHYMQGHLHAKRHTSAVLAVVRYVSVCLSVSVTSRSYIETDGRIELDFGTGAYFHLSYTLCCRKIRLYPKYDHFAL